MEEYLEHISKVLRVESEEKIITTLQKDKDTWVKEYKKCLGPMAYPLQGLSLEESKERILYDPLANIGLIDILLNSLNIKSEAAEEKPKKIVNAVKVKEASVSVNNKIKKSKSNKSYNLLKGDAKELYKILLDMELLDLSTSEEQFINAFNSKKYSFPKIKWSLSDRLLAYFIEELYCNGFISIVTDKWAIAEIIFEGVNNKGLSTSRAHYLESKTPKPRHYQVVDEAIQSFMSTLSNPK